MKIKTLCTFVLAAVATVTAFTACSSGGDKSAQSGYISLAKFSNDSVIIQTWGSVTGLEIIPSSADKEVGAAGGSIVLPGTVHTEDEEYMVEGTVSVSGTIGVIGSSNSYPAMFVYSVLENGETGHLTFTLQDLSGATDKELINALGIPTSDDDEDGATGLDRVYLNSISSMSVDMLFTFATRKLAVSISGSGFYTTYMQEVNGVEEPTEGASPYPITIIQANRSYVVKSR